MKLKQKKSNREQAPEGVHLSRVVGLTSLGLQPGYTWNGKWIEPAYKIEITYELVNTLMEDERPFWVSEELTVTDFEKGNLHPRLVATGVKFDTIDQMIGRPCMITLEHNEKGYPKIVNVAGVPTGFEVPELKNATVTFDIYSDEPDMDTFWNFPEFKRDKILAALDLQETAFYQEYLKTNVEDDDI